jgi:hypothetical protein
VTVKNEGERIVRHRAVAALLVVGLVAGCGQSPSNPEASSVAAVDGASAASSPSPSPSPGASPTPSATPAPMATPEPMPAATPVPWKSYKSTRYHYSIKYAPDWIVTPGTAGYSDQFDNFTRPAVYVRRELVSGIASVSLTIPHEVAYFKSHFKARLLSNKSIRLAGWSGRILTFRGVEDGVKIAIQEIIIAKGHGGYFLTMYGDDATLAADRALFERMYLTWRAT